VIILHQDSSNTSYQYCQLTAIAAAHVRGSF
jgi:hypothetical protein